MKKCHGEHMKVAPNKIKIEVAFFNNTLPNSMYALKYLADLHTNGCVAAFVHHAVTSWITHHCEDDLKEENVTAFISKAKRREPSEPARPEETAEGVVSKAKGNWFRRRRGS